MIDPIETLIKLQDHSGLYECDLEDIEGVIEDFKALKSENEDFREEVIKCNRSIKNLQQCALADLEEYENLKAENERLKEKIIELEKIDLTFVMSEWGDA